MDSPEGQPNPFSTLDRTTVPVSWFSDLSHTLLTLDRSIGPIDRPILAPLTALVAKHSAFLNEQAGRRAHVDRPPGITESYPGCSTLFSFRTGNSKGLELFGVIGLCALQESSGRQREAVERFLESLRGALRVNNSDLSLAFGAVTSIPELVRTIGEELAKGRMPGTLKAPWEGWIKDTLLRWMRADPARLLRALEPIELVPDAEGTTIPIAETPGENESAVAADNFQARPSEGAGRESSSDRAGRAKSEHMERGSQGDLMAPADFRLPPELDEQLCSGAVALGRSCIDVQPDLAEPYVALALSLSGALREIDLRHVFWGGQQAATKDKYSIDPVLPVLYRRIKRPPDAINPPDELSGWLEPTLDVLAWPLPNSVHGLLQRLATEGEAVTGKPVLPLLAQSVGAPYRLVDVIGRVQPGLHVGVLMPRLALASRIAATFGSEFAQLSMADTFSMSAVPAYYSALPENDLVTWIAQDLSRRFGEDVLPGLQRTGYLGSRLVLTDSAARRWSQQLALARRTAATPTDSGIAAWRAHRDLLVAMLCCLTGHRPENAIGLIGLGDVIPEYELILLQDKQADALRAMRIAATGRRWLAELRKFLDRLIEIHRDLPEEPAGKIAAAILRCQTPLFTVPGEDGVALPMTVADLRQGMPSELQPVDNFYRHRLNQFLLRKRIDPELRHAQLGWVVSNAHFHADLSPRSPRDLARELGPALDELLVADGWVNASARKTRWTWDGIPMPDPQDWKSVFETSKRQHEKELQRIRHKLQQRWKEIEPPVLKRIATAFQELFPLLRVDLEKRQLVAGHGLARDPKVEMLPEHYALLIDHVRQGDVDPSSGLETIVARIVFYRLVRSAKSRGLVVGPIPGRPYLSVTSDPSPFVPGLGIAVRQSQAVREALVRLATPHWSHGMGALTVWSILAFSMYRRIPWAVAASRAAKDAVRASQRGHVLRVPAVVDGAEKPMVFGGAVAALLSRRRSQAPTALVPTPEAPGIMGDLALVRCGLVGRRRSGVAPHRTDAQRCRTRGAVRRRALAAPLDRTQRRRIGLAVPGQGRRLAGDHRRSDRPCTGQETGARTATVAGRNRCAAGSNQRAAGAGTCVTSDCSTNTNSGG